jgi:Excalibur calcium-binding domain
MMQQRHRFPSGRGIPAALLALGLLAGSLARPADAAPLRQGAPGAVVALRGTPHLWIADAQGVFHWAGDTRALTGRPVDWGTRRDAALDEVRALRRGDPWLSAGLVKLGEPIYFVKWETDQERPTLLHIQSIGDVELFGIDASNYGTYVLDQTAWEQRFGLPVAGLPRGVLAAATGGAPGGGGSPPPTATAAPAPPGPTPGPGLPPGFDPRRYVGQGDAYNCPDFPSQAAAQAVLRADPSDPNKLDTDRDGIACESNPGPYDTARVPR